MIRFECPACGRNGAASDDKAGAEVLCPSCSLPVRLPLDSGEAATTADPPETRADPDVSRAERSLGAPLTNPFHRLALLWFGLGAVLAAVAVWAFLTMPPFVGGAPNPRRDWLVAVGVFSGIAGFLLLVLALAHAYTAHKIAPELCAFARGEGLAHWTYEPDEWLRFTRADRRRALWDALRTSCLVLICGGIIGLIVGAFVWLSSGAAELASVLRFAAVPFAAAAILFGALIVLAGWMRSWRYRRAVAEAYLGRQAVYLGGGFWYWGRWGRRLTAVKWVDGNPDLLELTLQYGRGRYQVERKLRIPVPDGRWGEAKRIVREWSL